MIIIRVKNKDYQFVKPYYLMDTELFRLRKAVVKAGGLVWNIKGEQISYKQIKTKKCQQKIKTKHQNNTLRMQ